MNEKPPTIEDDAEALSEEYADLIKYYEDEEFMERLLPKEECGPHIDEFEEMIAPWLREDILKSLSSVETAEEAEENELRERAKEALIPILEKLRFLDRRTDISDVDLEKLRVTFKILSNATGLINSGKVDHDR